MKYLILNSKANEILRLFSSIHTYYPRKYKAVFKLKNATWNQNSQDSNPFVAAPDLLEKVPLFMIL